jgi:hypothetical protein
MIMPVSVGTFWFNASIIAKKQKSGKEMVPKCQQLGGQAKIKIPMDIGFGLILFLYLRHQPRTPVACPQEDAFDLMNVIFSPD